MYQIVLKTWYQETPSIDYKECLNQDFKSIEDAIEYLGKNYEDILDKYPVVAVSIEQTKG